MKNRIQKSEENRRSPLHSEDDTITLVYGKHAKKGKEYCWRVSDKTTLPESYAIQENDFLHVETVYGIAPIWVTRTEEAEENEQVLALSSIICKPNAKPAKKKPDKRPNTQPKRWRKKKQAKNCADFPI